MIDERILAQVKACAHDDVEVRPLREPIRMGPSPEEIREAVSAAQLTLSLLAGKSTHSTEEAGAYSSALNFLHGHFRRCARVKMVYAVPAETAQ